MGEREKEEDKRKLRKVGKLNLKKKKEDKRQTEGGKERTDLERRKGIAGNVEIRHLDVGEKLEQLVW